MIKVRNRDHEILVLRSPGTLTAAANKDVAMVPFAGFITNIVAKASDGGSGVTNSIADVHLNGTTIFGAATKITVTSTTGAVSYSAQTVDPTPVAAGDLLTLDVDSISTAPANLVVLVTVSKSNSGGAANLTDHNALL
jgi:hypothetical protein